MYLLYKCFRYNKYLHVLVHNSIKASNKSPKNSMVLLHVNSLVSAGLNVYSKYLRLPEN